MDGGSTNKCKKNIASVIITSMIAGLTEQQVTQVPVKALLCIFFSYFHQHLKNEDLPESVYFKTSPMLIPCLRGRNKLIVIVSLSFP